MDADDANEIQDPNNRNINEQERLGELRKLVGAQQARIQTLQSTAFQLANYYFVFQGVIVTAISNSSSLVCSYTWFVFLLSLLAAILNIFALASVGKEYVQVLNMRDCTWTEYNALGVRLHNRDNILHQQLENWTDKYKQGIRRWVLRLCIATFLGFTGVMLTGTWLICKHGMDSRRHQQDSGCFKLCNGS
ncbi:hypothetical protein F511_23666 [Dorcoceras hygrometricum]|uniref:Transmembrane protein n=1 Tax=Dorcoceras hygrometricum TaxID=472368 RepID=A0A2Z7DA48_9LAMI|nr:hypothetical protein F511_23666 [Dorcoceras hygrometricum]